MTLSPRPAGTARTSAKRAVLLAFTALISTSMALGIGLFALEASGLGPARQLWILRQQLLGMEEVGIWQDDARLGWRHLPNSAGRHRSVPDFDVRYGIDAEGHRATPASYSLPKVLMLGGSFTFGHGVENSEAYPARLEEALPGYKIINGAVNAWGTGQALLKLEESLERYDDIEMVIYGFIDHHRYRNYLRKEQLENLRGTRNRRAPYFLLEDDRAIYQGLADPLKDGLPSGPELDQSEFLITAALLREMRERAAARSIPFLVVYLPDGTPRLRGAWLKDAVGAEHFLDLRPQDPFYRNRFAYDFHPTPDGHQLVAEALAPRLQASLASNRNDSRRYAMHTSVSKRRQVARRRMQERSLLTLFSGTTAPRSQ